MPTIFFYLFVTLMVQTKATDVFGMAGTGNYLASGTALFPTTMRAAQVVLRFSTV